MLPHTISAHIEKLLREKVQATLAHIHALTEQTGIGEYGIGSQSAESSEFKARCLPARMGKKMLNGKIHIFSFSIFIFGAIG